MISVEVLGVWPTNKGAVLMLEALKQRLKQEFGDIRFAMNLDFPAKERINHRLWACLRREGGRIKFTTRCALQVLPMAQKAALGLIEPDQIDVVIDASGFAYGDFWGEPKARRRILNRLGRARKPKAAILLPQALGPFTDPALAKTMSQALPLYDLVFARDQQSFDHARMVAPAHASLFLAPDFTNLLKAPSLPDASDLRGRDLVIPNSKVIEGADATKRQIYLNLLKDAIDAYRARGREPTILIHEGAADLELARVVSAEINKPLNVVDGLSALEAKSVVAAARSVVSSRFHGLVSALSSGVPSLACGWSHKYDELMRDYGCGELSVHLDDQEPFRGRMNAFLDRVESGELAKVIDTHRQVEAGKSRDMWTRVVDLIEHRTGVSRRNAHAER